jgi:nitrous oxide reductase accessory protein NosL
MLLYTRLIIAASTTWLLVACSGEPTSGPREVKWEQESCERCRMVLSDRKHAAQVRFLEDDKGASVEVFDDVGCALVWLEDKPWKQDPRTEIWVADHRNGNWIDARTAVYVEDESSPMGYGLGAQSDPAPGGVDFVRAKWHIFAMEASFESHALQLKERLQQQATKRQTLPNEQRTEVDREQNE